MHVAGLIHSLAWIPQFRKIKPFVLLLLRFICKTKKGCNAINLKNQGSPWAKFGEGFQPNVYKGKPREWRRKKFIDLLMMRKVLLHVSNAMKCNGLPIEVKQDVNSDIKETWPSQSFLFNTRVHFSLQAEASWSSAAQFLEAYPNHRIFKWMCAVRNKRWGYISRDINSSFSF